MEGVRVCEVDGENEAAEWGEGGIRTQAERFTQTEMECERMRKNNEEGNQETVMLSDDV